MARWIALGVTLLLMGSCSFVSTNQFRGVVAPLGAILCSFLTLYLFIQERVAGAVRPPSMVLMDAETQRLLREQAERKRAEQEQAQQREAAGDAVKPGESR